MFSNRIFRGCIEKFKNIIQIRNIPLLNASKPLPTCGYLSINNFSGGGKKGDGKQDDKCLYRHCYHEDCERALNEQINAEMSACYVYLAIAAHFGRSEISLPGCYAFFFQMHLEELGHAHGLIRYQNMRGGKVQLCEMKPADDFKWNIKCSLEKGLQMEKDVKDKLCMVTHVADKHKDFSLNDFIVSVYIQAQEKSIQEYARLLQRYKSMSGCGTCGCVDFLFDKELHDIFTQKKNHEELKFTDDEKEFK